MGNLKELHLYNVCITHESTMPITLINNQRVRIVTLPDSLTVLAMSPLTSEESSIQTIISASIRVLVLVRLSSIDSLLACLNSFSADLLQGVTTLMIMFSCANTCNFSTSLFTDCMPNLQHLYLFSNQTDYWHNYKSFDYQVYDMITEQSLIDYYTNEENWKRPLFLGGAELIVDCLPAKLVTLVIDFPDWSCPMTREIGNTLQNIRMSPCFDDASQNSSLIKYIQEHKEAEKARLDFICYGEK